MHVWSSALAIVFGGGDKHCGCSAPGLGCQNTAGDVTAFHPWQQQRQTACVQHSVAVLRAAGTSMSEHVCTIGRLINSHLMHALAAVIKLSFGYCLCILDMLSKMVERYQS
jgi:hypothetical protein